MTDHNNWYKTFRPNMEVSNLELPEFDDIYAVCGGSKFLMSTCLNEFYLL